MTVTDKKKGPVNGFHSVAVVDFFVNSCAARAPVGLINTLGEMSIFNCLSYAF